MPLLVWDASALVKRYARELGSDTVRALFGSVGWSDMTTTLWGYAESVSILLRCLNRGAISRTSFAQAISALETETILNPDLSVLALDDTDVLTGVGLIQQHNLNSVDAALLAAILRFDRLRPPGSPPLVLVAADLRLLRAAQADGLTTLNPEHLPATDVSSFLAAL